MVSKDTDTPLPADWAIEEALRRVKDAVGEAIIHWDVDRILGDKDRGYAQGIILAARLIEQHEQPPADPDVEAVKRIISKWQGGNGIAVDAGVWRSRFEELDAAVAQYKQEVENRG